MVLCHIPKEKNKDHQTMMGTPSLGTLGSIPLPNSSFAGVGGGGGTWQGTANWQLLWESSCEDVSSRVGHPWMNVCGTTMGHNGPRAVSQIKNGVPIVLRS